MSEATSTWGNGRDGELSALDDLADHIEENARDEHLLAGRVRKFRAGRARGRSWQDLLARDRRPGTLQLAARVLRGATEGSGVLRRALARGLRTEGATIPDIAEQFGVSHQRISAVLRRDETAMRESGHV